MAVSLCVYVCVYDRFCLCMYNVCVDVCLKENFPHETCQIDVKCHSKQENMTLECKIFFKISTGECPVTFLHFQSLKSDERSHYPSSCSNLWRHSRTKKILISLVNKSPGGLNAHLNWRKLPMVHLGVCYQLEKLWRPSPWLLFTSIGPPPQPATPRRGHWGHPGNCHKQSLFFT